MRYLGRHSLHSASNRAYFSLFHPWGDRSGADFHRRGCNFRPRLRRRPAFFCNLWVIPALVTSRPEQWPFPPRPTPATRGAASGDWHQVTRLGPLLNREHDQIGAEVRLDLAGVAFVHHHGPRHPCRLRARLRGLPQDAAQLLGRCQAQLAARAPGASRSARPSRPTADMTKTIAHQIRRKYLNSAPSTPI